MTDDDSIEQSSSLRARTLTHTHTLQQSFRWWWWFLNITIQAQHRVVYRVCVKYNHMFAFYLQFLSIPTSALVCAHPHCGCVCVHTHTHRRERKRKLLCSVKKRFYCATQHLIIKWCHATTRERNEERSEETKKAEKKNSIKCTHAHTKTQRSVAKTTTTTAVKK